MSMEERVNAKGCCCKCWSTSVNRGASLASLLLGLGFFCMAIFVPPAITRELTRSLDNILILSEESQRTNSDVYRLFTDPYFDKAPEIFMRVHMFHVENPKEAAAGAKPRLEVRHRALPVSVYSLVGFPLAAQERGPYVYKELAVKLNVTFGADRLGRKTVSYRVWRYFVFDRAQTPQHLDPWRDRVTTLNLPFQVLKNVGLAAIYANASLTDADRLFTTRPVHEHLFGYRDPAMEYLHSIMPDIPAFYPGTVGNQTHIENATALPPDTVFTGQEPYEHLVHKFVKWQGVDTLTIDEGSGPVPLWGTAEANRIHGSDGTQFPRDLRKGESIEVWVPDLEVMRPAQNVGGEELTFKKVKLLRFTLPVWATYNATLNPDNAAYYIFGPSGLANITRRKYAELFLSKPHFLDCDSWLGTRFEGLSPPRADVHDTIMDVEPLTGLPMRAFKRLQVNVRVRPFTYKPVFGQPQVWFKDVPETYWPMNWVDEGSEVPDPMAEEFANGVYTALALIDTCTWVGWALGFFFVCLSFALLFFPDRCAPRRAPLRLSGPYGSASSYYSTDDPVFDRPGLERVEHSDSDMFLNRSSFSGDSSSSSSRDRDKRRRSQLPVEPVRLSGRPL